jgi:hypothetical protein
MAKKKATTPKRRTESTLGLKPDILKIDGNWEDAVKKSFQKNKPAGGWPKP